MIFFSKQQLFIKRCFAATARVLLSSRYGEMPGKKKSKNLGSDRKDANFALQQAIRRQEPPVHLWTAHVLDEQLDSNNASSDSPSTKNTGRGATKMREKDRAKGKSGGVNATHEHVCSSHFFDRRGCQDRKKCTANHDIKPLHETLSSSSTFQPPGSFSSPGAKGKSSKAKPKMLSIQSYRLLSDVDEISAYKCGNDKVVYAVANGDVLFSPEGGLRDAAMGELKSSEEQSSSSLPLESTSESTPSSAAALSQTSDVPTTVLFSRLPDDALYYIFTFLPLHSYGLTSLTCKAFMERFWDASGTSHLYTIHKWRMPAETSEAVPTLRDHLAYKRNFSALSAHSKCTKSNTYIRSLSSHRDLHCSICLLGDYCLSVAPPSSVAVYKFNQRSQAALATVRATPFKKNNMIWGLCCNSSYVYTFSNFGLITVMPTELVLSGEGGYSKDDDNARVFDIAASIPNCGEPLPGIVLVGEYLIAPTFNDETCCLELAVLSTLEDRGMELVAMLHTDVECDFETFINLKTWGDERLCCINGDSLVATYDVSADDPGEWSLVSDEGLAEKENWSGLFCDKTGRYTVSRTEEWQWNLKFGEDVLASFFSPHHHWFNLERDAVCMSAMERFVFVKCFPVVDGIEKVECLDSAKKKKKSGGRMAKQASTKGMKVKIRKKC